MGRMILMDLRDCRKTWVLKCLGKVGKCQSDVNIIARNVPLLVIVLLIIVAVSVANSSNYYY